MAVPGVVEVIASSGVGGVGGMGVVDIILLTVVYICENKLSQDNQTAKSIHCSLCYNNVAIVVLEVTLT